MFSTVKYMEILPKHNEYGFIFECFAINWYIYLYTFYQYFHCNGDLKKICSLTQ